MKQDPSRGGASSPVYDTVRRGLAESMFDTAKQALRDEQQRRRSQALRTGFAPAPAEEPKKENPWLSALKNLGGAVISIPATGADIVAKPFEAIPGFPDVNPEDVGSFNFFVQGGKSLEHVGGDAYQLGRSIITGKDTLSESPSAKAWKAAGGGLPGVLAVAGPYLDVGSVVAPMAMGAARGAGLVAPKPVPYTPSPAIAQSAANEAAERAAMLNRTTNAARVATGNLDRDAYDEVVGKYLEYLAGKQVPPSRRVGQIVVDPSSMTTRRFGQAQRNIAMNAGTDAAPTTMLVGVNPDKATTIIGGSSSYGPMFDADKMAQIASERETYNAKFARPELLDLMRREGVDIPDAYSTDRLIVESQLFGLPFDTPVGGRPIYAVDPNRASLYNVAGYTGSPDRNRFSLGFTYDIEGRPITLTEQDSFPTYDGDRRIYPPELGGVLRKPGNYQEMQVYGGQIPSENLRGVGMMFANPDSMRYTNPEAFFRWAKENYPQDVGPLVKFAANTVENSKAYVDRLLKVVEAAREKGIPLTAQQLGAEMIEDIDQFVTSGTRLTGGRKPYEGYLGPSQQNYFPTPVNLGDPDSIVAALTQASKTYDDWLKWYASNGEAYDQYSMKLRALENKASKGRFAANRRNAERLALSKATSGFTAEDIAKAREVTPYPANSLPQLEDFLVQASNGNLEEAAQIWESINAEWSRIINEGRSIPANQRYWMTTKEEGLQNLVDAGLLTKETVAELRNELKDKLIVDEDGWG